MASRFWVAGGTGNWNSTTNWAATSGGASGVSFPVSTDDVFVDSLSGTSPTITVNATSACLSLNFTGAITPTFAGTSALNVFGSLTRISTMTWNYSGVLTMSATATGKTFTSAGGSFPGIITFSGVGGGWTLQDAITVTGAGLNLTDGILNTNGMAISATTFNITGANTRTLTLGASIVTVSANWTATNTTNLTFNCNTSTIILTGAANNFNGGGLTYNNVSFSANFTIIGSNTFNTLTIAAGKTLKFTSGTTQTVTSLVSNGTLSTPSTLQSVTAGSAATIVLPAGRYFIRHTSVKDMAVSGATSMTDIAGTDVSGNTGITFVAKFEMGRIKNDGSFNWYSSATGTVTKVSG